LNDVKKMQMGVVAYAALFLPISLYFLTPKLLLNMHY